MSTNDLDFKGLADFLLRDARMLVPAWLPGGRLRGREYVCADLRGGVGDSLSVNLDTGRWADFAGDAKGGDLISIYAAIEGIGQGEAAKKLAADFNYQIRPEPIKDIVPVPSRPPIGALPPVDNTKYGKCTASWCYADAKGPLFYIARYDPPGERKQFLPFTWIKGKWEMKAYPEPRPLYGLDRLLAAPDKAVLVVEGEKACVAAQRFAENVYTVVSWPGGAKALSKVDFSPLYGRSLLLWPDADGPGNAAMEEIASLLVDRCPEIKIIDVKQQPDGWDAADCHFTWDKFVDWAKPRAHVYNKAIEAQVIPPNSPAPEEDEDGPTSKSATWDKLGIMVATNGQPINNLENAARVLENWPKFERSIWWDDFHQKVMTTFLSDFPRPWSDHDDREMTRFMQGTLGLQRMTDDLVHKASLSVSYRDRRNEPRDWINELVWDGTERISGFMVNHMGAPDNEYIRAASRNFWIGIAARTFRPGCKLDNMVILEGGQGKFKSTALTIIGGGWFVDAGHQSIFNKDFFLTLQGKLIVEIGEMQNFNKAEVAAVKQIVTCQSDRYRSPYGRIAEDHPRQSIFVGTTNENEYLRDNTGARRFWPIQCGYIDLAKIADDRVQLFAEAAAMFKKGEKWYEMPAERTKTEQEARRQIDEWENIIEDFLIGKNQATVGEIAYFLKIDAAHLGLQEQRRIGGVLRVLGWDKRTARDGHRTKKVWERPAPAKEEKSDVLPLQEEPPFA